MDMTTATILIVTLCVIGICALTIVGIAIANIIGGSHDSRRSMNARAAHTKAALDSDARDARDAMLREAARHSSGGRR